MGILGTAGNEFVQLSRTQERGADLSEEPCRVRSEYERDANRVLYCEDFRR